MAADRVLFDVVSNELVLSYRSHQRLVEPGFPTATGQLQGCVCLPADPVVQRLITRLISWPCPVWASRCQWSGITTNAPTVMRPARAYQATASLMIRALSEVSTDRRGVRPLVTNQQP